MWRNKLPHEHHWRWWTGLGKNAQSCFLPPRERALITRSSIILLPRPQKEREEPVIALKSDFSGLQHGCFHWACDRPECIPEPFLSTAGKTEAVLLSWAYIQALSLCPSPSTTFTLPFGHCQAHISERKQLFKPRCNWFWHFPFKVAGRTPSPRRQRSMQVRGQSEGQAERQRIYRTYRSGIPCHTGPEGVGFPVRGHYKPR